MTRLGWFRRALGVAAVAYAAQFAWTGRLVGQAAAFYWEGRLDEAHRSLSRARFWLARRGLVDDALGLVDLSRDRAAEAASHLSDARKAFLRPAAFGEERALLDLLRRGRFRSAEAYAIHRLAVSRTPSTLFYLGAAEKGLGRLADAERHLIEAASHGSMRQRAQQLRAVVSAARSHGRIEYLFDRRGTPIGAVDPASGRSSLLVPGLAALLEGPRRPRLEPGDEAGRIDLTLDLEVQQAAQAALGTRRGFLVAIDPRRGGLLAAASQPPSIGALDEILEPGSIIKMVTLSAALRAGLDIASLFPMECPGWISIDGVAFRDWTTHHRIDTIQQAVAVSCNIAFGMLGERVGRAALDAELRRYGFDVPESALQAAGDLSYATGRLIAQDAAHPAFALARRAEGLDSLTITPIHAALLAAGLARRGAKPSIYLVQEKRNILGEVTYRHAVEATPGASDLLPPERAALLVGAMKAAVTSPDGTARRAAVAGVSAAMKTGTSGVNPPGYDALVIGFAPAENPTIAWALVARRAGKAELEGARMTKEFLARIADMLK